MDYVVCATIFTIITLIVVVFNFKITLIKIEELKDFKKNGYKIQATIVSYDSRYNIDSDIEYCPIYAFKSPEGKSITLSSDMYTHKQVFVGTTKEIYYNPNRPTKCYNSELDIIAPISIMILSSVVFTCSSIVLILGAV